MACGTGWEEYNLREAKCFTFGPIEERDSLNASAATSWWKWFEQWPLTDATDKVKAVWLMFHFLQKESRNYFEQKAWRRGARSKKSTVKSECLYFWSSG